MTVTIPDPNTILDFAAAAFILLLVITTVMAKAVSPVGRGTVSLMLLGVIVALLSNCAAVQSPPVNVDTASVDRCQGLIALACTHDDRCGGDAALDCMAEQGPPCSEATELTQEESNTCARAMLETPCGGAYPAECRNIIGPEQTRESPQPDSRSL